MERSLCYNIDADYMIEKGADFCYLLKQWLCEQGIEALVYDITFEDLSSLIIDYSFDLENYDEKIKGLTEQFLKRFNIGFEIDSL